MGNDAVSGYIQSLKLRRVRSRFTREFVRIACGNEESEGTSPKSEVNRGERGKGGGR